MKAHVLLFTILFSFGLQAQSNYYSTFLANPNLYAEQLVKLPWDASKLYQVTRDVDQSSGVFYYTIDDVSTGAVVPISIPLINQVRGEPTFVDDGILFSAIAGYGIELVYFDGVNSTIFDLNSGVGDSDPVIQEIDDRVFVVANDGNNTQLYEFDKSTHLLEQITTGMVSIQSVCATWDGDVFYSTKSINTTFNEDEYQLIKASSANGSYSFTTIQTIGFPIGINGGFNWKHPVLKDGLLYFSAVHTHTDVSLIWTVSIFVVYPDDQMYPVNLILPSLSGEFKLFEWDGLLCVYSDSHDTLYSSPDAVNFTEMQIPAGNSLIEHRVSSNNKLYFTSIHPDDSRELFQFDGSFVSIRDGEHLHFLLEDNDILYYSDYRGADSSSIVLVYTGIDFVDEVKIVVGSHSPDRKSAVMYNGLFTFLFTNGGFVGHHDIFQLTGSPSVDLDELELEMSLYPNPISTGDVLSMRALRDGEVELINTSGSVVKRFDLINGEAHLNTSFLSPGVYLISFMNRTQRIVVQ
ncbi:MAG: T9SS type A sorting domain-containing protein [Crocinitomicaceae bacterium]|nr:T9SS type A sorting domain-containing protein [Crocinitomicaceae bacterium]